MKVLLINGSPKANGCTYTALEEITKELSKENIEYEIFHIGKNIIRGCVDCRVCKKTGSGYCVFKDDVVNETIDKIKAADAVIVGSPVYYAGISGQVKSLLDRVFFAGAKDFANKLGASVVSCRRGGASSAFDQLNHYFSISKMPLVASQYWNQVHGNTVEEVIQDVEGLQTMRTLAKNMIWLLKCIEIADQNNLPRPTYEEWTPTNFIR